MSKMKLFAVAALGAALAFPSLGWAEPPPPPAGAAASIPAPKASQAQSSARVANQHIILCYTCGGSFSRYIGQKNLGGVNWVWEYGSGCSGNIRYVRDRNPYFCAFQ